MKLMIDIGDNTLEVEVEKGTDLDGRFKARDLEDGRTIYINGWLIDNVEAI